MINDMAVEETHNEILRSLGRIEGRVESILEQATKTNGRVTKLEEGLTTLKVQEGITTTKITLISAIGGAIGGLILSIFNPFK